MDRAEAGVRGVVVHHDAGTGGVQPVGELAEPRRARRVEADEQVRRGRCGGRIDQQLRPGQLVERRGQLERGRKRRPYRQPRAHQPQAAAEHAAQRVAVGVDVADEQDVRIGGQVADGREGGGPVLLGDRTGRCGRSDRTDRTGR